MANRDFSDLVANGDTNLAVAAVGDYLLIYDISEPLDVNKIKVIPVANLANAVNPLKARQGGHATSWATSGNTNYTPGSSKIQTGIKTVAIANGVSSGSATITFPEAFAHKPIVLLTVTTTSGVDADPVPIGAYAYFAEFDVSTVDVDIKAARSGTTGAISIAVSWIAIGD